MIGNIGNSITFENLVRFHGATPYSCMDAPLRPQLRSVEPLQSACSLTVPARGRSASALSARYMLRASAIVVNASRTSDSFLASMTKITGNSFI